jgi:hypothetical protein
MKLMDVEIGRRLWGRSPGHHMWIPLGTAEYDLRWGWFERVDMQLAG